MTKEKIAHDLALIYADSKLKQYQIDHQENLACGNIEMTEDEINYLESAYLFAIKNFSKVTL